MGSFTLNDFYNRIDYLSEKGTLADMLEFLEVQCVEGTERDVYKLANTDLMVFDVLHSEAKVRFQTFSPEGVGGEVVEDFFITLFEDLRELLAILLKLLEEKYSHLGFLTFEEQYRDNCFAFEVNMGAGGWYVEHIFEK